MKKLWAILLAAALLLALTLPAMADGAETWGEYGDNLTWEHSELDGTVTIRGTGEMWDWPRSSRWTYRGKWDEDYYFIRPISSLELEVGVTSIGNWAFASAGLFSVTIPESVTSIGDYAFHDNYLESITIPASVTNIGNAAFGFSQMLQTFQVADDNPNFAVVDGVLFNRDATTLLCYPAGKTAAEYTIPSSVTSIGDGAFDGCVNLKSIRVSGSNPSFTVVDGVLFDRDATTLLCYPAGKTTAEYTIPNGVTKIGSSAFAGCSNLTSVTIPNSVTHIGDDAFSGCGSLMRVTIPSSVTHIGDGSFFDCYSLTSVAIPGSVSGIGEYAFADCNSLTSVTIQGSVSGIGKYAFAHCDSLTQISIPDSVTDIEDGAFFSCSSLSEVMIPNSVSSIGNSVFEDCHSLTGISIPNSVTSIGEGAFCNSSLTNVAIPDGVTSIRDSTFHHCYRLTSVTIPSGVTSIGDWAFYDCSSLTSITIPDSVTSIGDEAFYLCDGLTSVTIPGSVTSIGDGAFVGCYSLENIHVVSSNPSYSDVDGVLFNRDSTVLHCYPNGKDADAYTIPDGVTRIGDSAFIWCNLTNVTIPNSVTSIGDRSFTCCASLTSITIPDGVTTIGDYAFEYCSSLTSVTIPVSVTNIGGGAFSLNPWGENSLTDVYYNGTENQWNAIDIGSDNDSLLNATIHFNGGNDPEPVHIHTLTHQAARPADCTQDGNVEYWYCADCGKYFADAQAGRELRAAELKLPALGHDWGAWVRVKQPTATENGRDTRTCARCGETEYRVVLATTPATPETPTEPPEISPEPHSFTDVPETAWFAEAVDYAWNNGLMQGVSETAFAPDATATRAMLVTILYRMAKEPEANAATFADVDTGAWFADAVAWAAENGVVSGYEDGLFHPERDITREQLVTMLWRMAGQPEADPVETGAADWAAEAMSWAVGSGVILGDGSGYSPRRTATRAELAAILMRCEQSA